MAGGFVTHPSVRNDPPDPDDWGVVVRPIGIGVIIVSQTQPTTATHTVVVATVVPTVLLAANAVRLGAVFYNNSAGRFLFLRLGAGATTVAFSVRIGPQGFYEVEWPTYTGIVTGVWSAGAPGDAQITELT
jgi:hypothetical protein